jgi:hypothetical protein
MTGLLSGFVTKAEAMKTLLPSYLLTLAGMPLSDYLRAQDADTAASANGMDGFWLNVNSTPSRSTSPARLARPARTALRAGVLEDRDSMKRDRCDGKA